MLFVGGEVKSLDAYSYESMLIEVRLVSSALSAGGIVPACVSLWATISIAGAFSWCSYPSA